MLPSAAAGLDFAICVDAEADVAGADTAGFNAGVGSGSSDGADTCVDGGSTISSGSGVGAGIDADARSSPD